MEEDIFEDELMKRLLMQNQNADEKRAEEMMEKLLRETIPNILIDALPEEKEEMSQALEEEFRTIYKPSMLRYSSDENEERLDEKIEKIKEEWNKKTIERKRAELLKDEGLEEIITYSNRAYKMAQDRAKNGTIQNNESLYNEIENKLSDLSKVKEFNKSRAQESISEGLVDLQYAYGKTENTSLRIGRYK